MTDLRVLSLHQPWASLVAVGVKTIETRSWPTKHRGRIGIASTKREVFAPTTGDPPVITLAACYVALPGGRFRWIGPLGAIVATANLVDCVPIVADGDHELWPERCVVTNERLYSRNDLALWSGCKIRPVGTEELFGGHQRERTFMDQRPYGDYRPGRWAWLLDDVKPTTERCPACWGIGVHAPSGPSDEVGWCETCHTHRKCDPVPVEGHQRLWTWRSSGDNSHPA